MAEGHPPRVLYVEPTGGVGGSGMSLLALTGGLDRYAAFVVLPAEGRLASTLRDIHVPVRLAQMAQGSRRSPWLWALSVVRLAILCRRLGVRLVHANHEFANRHAWPAARLAGVPYVCHVRNIQSAESFRHCWLNLPPVLVANSQATAQSFASQMRKGQRSLVVYNGVDLRYFDGRRMGKKAAGFAEGEFVIAQVGRITPDKGVHIFVDAMGALAKRYPFVRAAVAGDAAVFGSEAYASDVSERAERLGLDGRISFLGHVTDVRNVYSVADVVVQPSASEGFGRAAMEAMAMKIPVIATDVGGPREIIEDGVSGLLVPSNDPQALANAIRRLIEDKALATRLAENGRRVAEKRFSQERHVAQIQALYDQVLGG